MSLRLNQTQIKSLNVCWNSVYRKIFKFNRWAVSAFINGLGYLDFTHMYYVGVFKSMKDMLRSNNHVLNSLVAVYNRENTFCQQLSLFDINLNMPMYVIRRLVIEHFNNAVK
jgi:hypothetical protein